MSLVLLVAHVVRTRVSWKQLALLGNVQFLKVSYVVLVVVPLMASIQSSSFSAFFSGVPLTMRLGYFASLILSLAHMIYQGFCPEIIKRFESPNDLYRDMLQIKALQSQYLPRDTGFAFHIRHCRESFTRANNSTWGARLACTGLYALGIAIVAWVAVEQSLAVFWSSG